MTTKQLKNRISFTKTGYGHFKITIKWRGKEYHHTSTDTLAIDRINSDEAMFFYKTEKQALSALYNATKYANDLK